jgi:hypothetical protein
MMNPIPVATRSKEWVCCRSLAGIAGSNLAGGMDVCHECCVLSGIDHSSREAPTSVTFLSDRVSLDNEETLAH